MTLVNLKPNVILTMLHPYHRVAVQVQFNKQSS